MICVFCLKQNRENFKVCGFCGRKNDSLEAKPKPIASSTEIKGVPKSFEFSRVNSQTQLDDKHTFSVNSEIRSLFVIGSQSTNEEIQWIKNKFPMSQYFKFTTPGAVREAVARMVAAKAIDFLCILGTSKTIPPYKLHDKRESEEFRDKSGRKLFKVVESDLFFSSNSSSLSEIPEDEYDGKLDYIKSRFSKLTAEDICGVIPVGRIPFDDLASWQNYFNCVEKKFIKSKTNLIAISDSTTDWQWECSAVFDHLGVNGDLKCIPDDLSNFLLNCAENNGLQPNSKLIINLHGGPPNEYQQIFVDNVGNPFNPLEIGKFPNSLLFLYPCYGGNSGWWEKGVIPSFLKNEGRAVIASSTMVYCSSPEEDGLIGPGAVQLCAEFFDKISKGYSYGESLNYAKSKTLTDALNSENDWLFCKALKEIIQFSLYGAPWLTEQSSDKIKENELLQADSKLSLLDQIRNHDLALEINSDSPISLLDKIRNELRIKMINKAEEYECSNAYVLNKLGNLDHFKSLKTQLSDDGYDSDDSVFDMVIKDNNVFHMVTIPSQNFEKNRSSILLILDSEGRLIKSYKTKGQKNGIN
jgi:hypothetical protein